MKKVFLLVVGVVFIALAAINVNLGKSEKISNLMLSNLEALASGESGSGGGYSCSISLKCCGISSNVTVSCTGTDKCETLTDIWGYPCKGVKCDKKETLC